MLKKKIIHLQLRRIFFEYIAKGRIKIIIKNFSSFIIIIKNDYSSESFYNPNYIKLIFFFKKKNIHLQL